MKKKEGGSRVHTCTKPHLNTQKQEIGSSLGCATDIVAEEGDLVIIRLARHSGLAYFEDVIGDRGCFFHARSCGRRGGGQWFAVLGRSRQFCVGFPGKATGDVRVTTRNAMLTFSVASNSEVPFERD